MLSVSAEFVKTAILFSLWLEHSWEFYLSIRQFRKATNTPNVPTELTKVITEETYQKTRDYHLAKLKFGFIKSTYSTLITTVVIYKELLALVWDYSVSINPFVGEVSVSCIWIFLLSTASTIIDLPLTIYHTFVLEEKFGFNKQTAGFFVWDKIKAFILSQTLSLMISSIIIVIIQNGGDYFFVWLWLVISILSLILLTVYPALIAPLFDKYTPLPEGELKNDIEKLASELKFPLTQLYIVEGSKRSSHSNAYFYGLFKSKRIVLFDTLISKDDGTGCSKDEILAVLSHELGHWYHSHTLKNLLIIEVNLFLLFAAFSSLFTYKPLYGALGFFNIQPVLVGLIVVIQYVMMPYNTLLSFMLTCLSRRFEFQADEFAVRLGKGEFLKKSLLQLNKDNLGFPVYDNLYSTWHHSHPPISERIAVLDSFSSKDK